MNHITKVYSAPYVYAIAYIDQGPVILGECAHMRRYGNKRICARVTGRLCPDEPTGLKYMSTEFRCPINLYQISEVQ